MVRALELVALIGGALGSLGVIWRVTRGARRLLLELLKTLDQIRDASGATQRLALEVHGLAGAVTHFAIRNEERITALEARTGDLADVIVELSADVARLSRQHRKDTQRDHETS